MRKIRLLISILFLSLFVLVAFSQTPPNNVTNAINIIIGLEANSEWNIGKIQRKLKESSYDSNSLLRIFEDLSISYNKKIRIRVKGKDYTNEEYDFLDDKTTIQSDNDAIDVDNDDIAEALCIIFSYAISNEQNLGTDNASIDVKQKSETTDKNNKSVSPNASNNKAQSLLSIVLAGLALIISITNLLIWLFKTRKKENARDTDLIEMSKNIESLEKEKQNSLKRLSNIEETLQTNEFKLNPLTSKIQELETTFSSIKTSLSEPSQSSQINQSTPLLELYYSHPSAGIFNRKERKDSFDAYWRIKLMNENAQEGNYYVNDQKESELLNNPEMYLKPFVDIQNLYEVAHPTQIKYITDGIVSRTPEGYWRITSKAKVKLL